MWGKGTIRTDWHKKRQVGRRNDHHLNLAIRRFRHFETPAVDLQIQSRGSTCLFLGQIDGSGVLQGKDNLFPQGFNTDCGLIKK